MKLLLSLMLAVGLVGCNIGGDNPSDQVFYGTKGQIIKIRNCEYAIYVGNNSGDFAMVHAEDCQNPIHKPSPITTNRQ